MHIHCAVRPFESRCAGMRGGFLGKATVAAPMDFWEFASRCCGDGSAGHLMILYIAITFTFTFNFNFNFNGCATLLLGFHAV